MEQLKIQEDINNLCEFNSKQNFLGKPADVLLLTVDNLDEELNKLISKNIGQSINSKKEKCKFNKS